MIQNLLRYCNKYVFIFSAIHLITFYIRLKLYRLLVNTISDETTFIDTYTTRQSLIYYLLLITVMTLIHNATNYKVKSNINNIISSIYSNTIYKIMHSKVY